MFSEEFVWEVLGSLEYDPDVPAENRTQHREFLKNVAVFKEVVPIRKVTKAKIHQTYRIQYQRCDIAECVGRPSVPDVALIMLFNNAEVVRELDEDPLFLNAFEKLNAEYIHRDGRKWSGRI